jgi:hypothetical protein
MDTIKDYLFPNKRKVAVIHPIFEVNEKEEEKDDDDLESVCESIALSAERIIHYLNRYYLNR